MNTYVVEKKIVGGKVVVTIQYGDGADSFTEQYTVTTVEQLKERVSEKLSEISKAQTLVSAVANGAFDSTLPATPAPTAEETWFKNYYRLGNLHKLVIYGVFTGDETAIVNLKNKVKNDFLPEYVNKM